MAADGEYFDSVIDKIGSHPRKIEAFIKHWSDWTKITVERETVLIRARVRRERDMKLWIYCAGKGKDAKT